MEEDDRQIEALGAHVGSTHVLLASLTFRVLVSMLIWKFLSGYCGWRVRPQLVCVALQDAGTSSSLSLRGGWNKSRLLLVTQTLPLG